MESTITLRSELLLEAEWSDRTKELMQAAGWYPGRSLDIAPWLDRLATEGFKPFEAAVAALREFGALHVEQTGPGRRWGRMRFDLNPVLLVDEIERFKVFSKHLGVRLFPIGELGHWHANIAIAEDGRVFLLGDDASIELAPSMFAAIDALIEGGMETRTSS